MKGRDVGDTLQMDVDLPNEERPHCPRCGGYVKWSRTADDKHAYAGCDAVACSRPSALPGGVPDRHCTWQAQGYMTGGIMHLTVIS